MNKRLIALYLAFPIALVLGTGAAHAQLKAPTKSQSKDGLGSGLGAPAPQTSPAPAEASPPSTAPSAPSAPSAPPAAELTRSSDEVVQDIANCVLAGLPADWTLAQIEVREIGRSDKQREFEAFYSYKDGAGKAASFTPCDRREPALNVYKLNSALEAAKRNWTRATLVFSKEGKFELQYDYAGKEADKDAKPATDAKPAASDAKKSAKKDVKKKPPQ